MAELLRRATRCDIPALLAIRNTPFLFEEYFAEARAGVADFLVHVRDDAVVAFARLKHPHDDQPDKLRPRFSDVCVDPRRRCEGIGAALIGELEALARSLGHEVAYIGVDPVENVRAYKLYQRLGYLPLHPQPRRATMVLHDRNGGPATTVEYWKLDLVKRLGA